MCWLQYLPSYVGMRDQDRARDGKRREVRTKELAFHKPPRAGTEPKEFETLILNVAFWVVTKVYLSRKEDAFYLAV